MDDGRLVQLEKEVASLKQQLREIREILQSDYVPSGSRDDPLYDDAVDLVCEVGKASPALLQRGLKIGYARAARLMDILEEHGIVGMPDGSKPRDVLVARPKKTRTTEIGDGSVLT